MHICFRRCSIENGGIEMFSFDYVKDFDPEVAQNLAHQLGGKITLESEPNVKTTFTVKLRKFSY